MSAPEKSPRLPTTFKSEGFLGPLTDEFKAWFLKATGIKLMPRLPVSGRTLEEMAYEAARNRDTERSRDYLRNVANRSQGQIEK